MKKLMLVAVLVLGCGPSFPGTYSGVASEVFACPSGTNGAASGIISWTITQSGQNLSITAAGGACNPVPAVLDSKSPDSATISSKTCVPIPDPFGGQLTESIQDGDIVLDSSGDLTFYTRSFGLFHDPGFEDETCPFAHFGLLERQK